MKMTTSKVTRPRMASSPPVRGGKKGVNKEPEGTRTDPTKICMIAGITAMVLLGVLGLFLFLGSSGVQSIAVGGVDARETVIWFEVRTTGKGTGSFTGEVDVSIAIADPTAMEGFRSLLSTTARVRKDYGTKEVPYTQFLQGNGEYRIVVSADGKASDTSFLVTNLVTSLDVEWSTMMPDPARPEYFVMVDITYMAGLQQPRSTRYPSSFSFDGELIGPSGPSKVAAPSSSIYTVQKAVLHTKKGEYSLIATLVNLDCAEGAPGRTVSVKNETFFFDAPPFADAGEDVTVRLMNGTALVELDGRGSWDDSGIVEYIWDFDDGTSESTRGPFVRHTYVTPGNYTVTLTVKDDSGQYSVQDAFVSSLTVTVMG